MQLRDILGAIVGIALCQTAGIVGSIFTVGAIDSWYAMLVRPEFSPPNWVFGPVWTLLYALMGIAAYIVFKQAWHTREGKVALGVFAVQLFLNTLWSILFFGMQRIDLALLDIALLWLAIIATMYFFAKVSRTAVWLLVPYLLWVSFAAYLNYAIFVLN